ncbi:hypothetical protein D3C79_906910 [compost metagenome]
MGAAISGNENWIFIVNLAVARFQTDASWQGSFIAYEAVEHAFISPQVIGVITAYNKSVGIQFRIVFAVIEIRLLGVLVLQIGQLQANVIGQLHGVTQVIIDFLACLAAVTEVNIRAPYARERTTGMY